MPTNYPTNLDTYTTKVDNVSDVMAADVNNLQDAMVAVQNRVGTTASPTFVTVATAQTISGAKTYSSVTTNSNGRYTTNNASLAMYEMHLPGIAARAWRTDTSGNARLSITNGSGTVSSDLATIDASGNLTLAGRVTAATLGSGTANSGTYLAGNLAWQTITMPSTDFGGVGSYAVLVRPINNNLGTGGTEAGSNLRHSWTPNTTTLSGVLAVFAGGRLRDNNATYDGGGTALSGTWRRVCGAGLTYGTMPGNYINILYLWSPALYVRIS